MRKAVAIFLLLSFLFSSCKNDLDLFAEYQEIPVVYGLLDISDSVHYVKIFRAFSNNEADFYDVAQDPDSLFYPDILAVTITELETGIIYELLRVDGNNIGKPALQGIFSSEKNILYRFSGLLTAGNTYQLKIVNTETGHEASAQTTAVGPFISYNPTHDNVINWKGEHNESVNFAWKAAEYAAIYELWMTFNYEEYDAFSGTHEDKSLSWPIFLNKITLNNTDHFLNYEYFTEAFFLRLKALVEETENFNRKPVDASFKLTAGGEELALYISNIQANQGITSLMAHSTYTNIKNGKGIFSSRYSEVFETEIGIDTEYYLCHGPHTYKLNFCF